MSATLDATLPAVSYLRLLLVPIWLLGFAVGVVAVGVVFLWSVAAVGYRDAAEKLGGRT